MTNNVKILSEETLSNYFFPLKKVKYQIEKKDGATEEVEREVYMSRNGATALLYNVANKNVILISQFRIPAYLNNHRTGVLLETCAGLLEENEDPTNAVIREIEEETGYRVQNAKKIFEVYSTAGSVAEMLHFYIAEYTSQERVGNGGGLQDESEQIEVIEMPFEEAFDKILSGEIKDAKTVILLQYAKINLFKDEEGEKVFDLL